MKNEQTPDWNYTDYTQFSCGTDNPQLSLALETQFPGIVVSEENAGVEGPHMHTTDIIQRKMDGFRSHFIGEFRTVTEFVQQWVDQSDVELPRWSPMPFGL